MVIITFNYAYNYWGKIKNAELKMVEKTGTIKGKKKTFYQRGYNYITLGRKFQRKILKDQEGDSRFKVQDQEKGNLGKIHQIKLEDPRVLSFLLS